MQLLNVPIESLEERYSAQWNKWFPEQLDKLGIDYQTVVVEEVMEGPRTIKVGEFLDALGTHWYKSRQMAEIVDYIYIGRVTDETIIFFHDLWFPGIEALFYIRDALGLRFKIAGVMHAGTYDPADWTAQHGMYRWAEGIERAWCSEVDYIFVGSVFHKNLLCSRRGVDRGKVHVTGLPIRVPKDVPDIASQEWLAFLRGKENIVVFPHRLAPEKRPEVFDEVAVHIMGYEKRDEYRDSWKFFRTKDRCNTKAEYYYMLRRAKIAVSCAQQETFGIAQQEAMLSGCIPLCPDRLAYPEYYSKKFLYPGSATEWNIDPLVIKVMQTMDTWEETVTSQEYTSTYRDIRVGGWLAISRMMKVLGL